ncbi:MAG TPA: ArsA-related P-loop ATPase, partial [Solirubrobacterales bacterium]|nr:ArsA-related P-loop ATPase [Solirubrobacterales bacterium]
LEIPLRGYSSGHPLFLPTLEIARNHPIPDLLDKRLVFVPGKGGVGKTTVAVALGLRAAAAGKRTIVCEVSSQENASRMFDHTEVGFHEVELEENLWSISIDPDESMREYVLLQLKVRAMRDMLFRSRIFNYLAAATPGLKELVTIGKIWELAQPDRKVKSGRKYDLVIVDAPATGHGIGFLQTPRTFAAIARVGPIHSQAQQLDRLITDREHTGVAIVALPEEMPVNESATLERDLLEDVGVAVDRVYMNGLYPERFSNEEAEQLAQLTADPDAGLRAAVRAGLSEHNRARSQRAQLARLRRRVQAPVKSLPFLFEPELGIEGARQLAKRLG